MLCLLSLVAGLLMASGANAASPQRPFPVVALNCGSDLRLCRAMVQALARRSPAFIYRINPNPVPPSALVLRLAFGAEGRARLYWPGGQSAFLDREARSDADFAHHIIRQSSPALTKVLSEAQ